MSQTVFRTIKTEGLRNSKTERDPGAGTMGAAAIKGCSPLTHTHETSHLPCIPHVAKIRASMGDCMSWEAGTRLEGDVDAAMCERLAEQAGRMLRRRCQEPQGGQQPPDRLPIGRAITAASDTTFAIECRNFSLRHLQPLDLAHRGSHLNKRWMTEQHSHIRFEVRLAHALDQTHRQQ
nr:hypothetical protein [Pseudomonas syringae]